MTFSTPDGAIAWAVRCSPMGAKAIDYNRIPGGQADAEMAQRVYSAIHAILGQLTERERQYVQAYALGASYREIAQFAGVSSSTIQRVHRLAWTVVRERLEDLEIIST